MISRLHSLSDHVVAFGRFLRQQGYKLSVDHLANALMALDSEEIAEEDFFFFCLQSSLCLSHQEVLQFRRHYKDYWSERARAEDSKLKEEKTDDRKPAAHGAPPIHELKKWLHGNHQKDEVEIETYSRAPTLEHKSLVELSQEEIEDVLKILQRISNRFRVERRRRYRDARKMKEFSMAKTIREGLSKGGEIVHVRYRKKKEHKFRLVVIADASRSMNLYSRFILHFLVGLRHVFLDLETFTFSLALRRITPELVTGKHEKMEFSDLLNSFAQESGGTQIGHSLHQFVEEFSSSMLHRNTKVVIISDGWDLGNVKLIEDSMFEIHRRCRQVLWLNPLKGNPDYRPEAKGMKTALPYIDHFLAANNLASLRSILPALFSHRRKSALKHTNI